MKKKDLSIEDEIKQLKRSVKRHGNMIKCLDDLDILTNKRIDYLAGRNNILMIFIVICDILLIINAIINILL